VQGSKIVTPSGIPLVNDEIPTTFVNGKQLTGKYTGSLWDGGNRPFAVVNPDGTSSNQVTVEFVYSSPTLNSIEPATVKADGQAKTFEIRGYGFAIATDVLANGVVQEPSKAQSGTKITVTMDKSLFMAAGNVTVTLKNPKPGGGTSKPFTITVK
jgi:hypothetical protein